MRARYGQFYKGRKFEIWTCSDGERSDFIKLVLRSRGRRMEQNFTVSELLILVTKMSHGALLAASQHDSHSEDQNGQSQTCFQTETDPDADR